MISRTPVLGGSSFLSGFTRLCKGLSVVLVGGYVVLQLFPPSLSFLALIPARTIPFAWNLITAGYIEQSLIEVAVSTVGLLFIGKLLEPIWGSREFLKFIFVVNFLTSICVFVTAIALYYITRQESFLPVLDPIASIFDLIFCRRSKISNETKGHTLGATPLPISDPIEASRRRERGARALEERLAAEKASSVWSTGDPLHRDVAESV